MANTTIKKSGINYMLICSDCGKVIATASEERKLPKSGMCPVCDNDLMSRMRAYNQERGHLYETKLRRNKR